MVTNTEKRRSICVVLTATLFSFLSDHDAHAQDFITIRVGEDLTTEMKIAIGDLIGSSSYNHKLASRLKDAIPIEDLCKPDSCKIDWKTAIEEIAKGNFPEEMLERLERLSQNYESLTGLRSVQPLPSLSLEPAGADEDKSRKFLLLRTDSDLYRAYKGTSTELSGSDSEIAAVPVPHFATGISAETTTSSDQSVTKVGAVLVDDVGVGTLAALDRDIENLGFTARTLEIPADTSDVKIQRALRIINESQSSSAALTNEAKNVDIDWPITDTTLSGVDGGCDHPHENWPFDVTQVDQLLSFNRDVLQELGQYHLERSNIVVVDSGISKELAQSADFRRLLYADTRELLSHGSYYPDASLQQPHCEDVDAIKTGNAFGHVPSAEPRDICVSHNPVGHLAPPPRSDRSGAYVPAHGGFVGGLAAGGPDLVEASNGVDRHIGLSFARIMWTNRQQDRIRSDAPDVAEAIQYATLRNADILNASLKVSNDLHNELREKLKKFRETDGLVIAAAGNSGGELLPNSQTFPAAMATPEGNDWLIVVGGVQRVSPSAPEIKPWPGSAFSSVLIDIAAPAAEIFSYDMSGRRMCQSGTSASAPQVSFVAGLLKSFGIRSAAEIKRRILATADHSDDFTTKVRGGRVLNVVNALDVFVDLVWLAGENEPKRVVLLSPEAVREDAVIMRVCDSQSPTLAIAKGWVDAKRLIYWRRLRENTAEIWHRRQAEPPITPLATKCTIGDTSFDLRYLDLSDGEMKQRPLSEIDRIVPSRLRTALPVAQRILLDNG